MATAADAGDYQMLATYFHYQELLLRAKAEKTLTDYAIHAGKYAMATKLVTRAEVISRECSHYLKQAQENAKHALPYEKMLTHLGMKPAVEPNSTVSLKGLTSQAFR